MSDFEVSVKVTVKEVVGDDDPKGRTLSVPFECDEISGSSIDDVTIIATALEDASEQISEAVQKAREQQKIT